MRLDSSLVGLLGVLSFSLLPELGSVGDEFSLYRQFGPLQRGWHHD